ncbi:MAG: HAD family hydrolase [Candidatus Rokubacteria bacterium]|nr:HAD family hydrolase [Candidatus Rokubacteria bacterium]
MLFDFGGTLDADGLTWKARFFRLWREEGLATSPEAFDAVFYRADDALVGAIPPTLTLGETVERLAVGLGAALGARDAAVAARVAQRFTDDALASLARSAVLLGRLSGRYRLGLVSNFYGNLATVCHNAAMQQLFGVIVDSTVVGLEKPDPRIFERALTALEVGAADAVFVGDSLPRDMAGARAVGMRHIWLAGETAPARPCCPGDPVVRALAEIEGLIP